MRTIRQRVHAENTVAHHILLVLLILLHLHNAEFHGVIRERDPIPLVYDLISPSARPTLCVTDQQCIFLNRNDEMAHSYVKNSVTYSWDPMVFCSRDG